MNINLLLNYDKSSFTDEMDKNQPLNTCKTLINSLINKKTQGVNWEGTLTIFIEIINQVDPLHSEETALSLRDKIFPFIKENIDKNVTKTSVMRQLTQKKKENILTQFVKEKYSHFKKITNRVQLTKVMWKNHYAFVIKVIENVDPDHKETTIAGLAAKIHSKIKENINPKVTEVAIRDQLKKNKSVQTPLRLFIKKHYPNL